MAIVVWAWPEKYGKDLDVTVSYIGQMVRKKDYTMQSGCIAKTRNQPGKPKVAVFMGKIESKKYPKAIRNSTSREQQIHVRKLCEQQGTKPAMSRLVLKIWLLLLRFRWGLILNPMKVVSSRKRDRLPKSQHGGETGNLAVAHQVLGGKCKEHGWLLGSLKGGINTRCIDDYTVSFGVNSPIKYSEKSCSS